MLVKIGMVYKGKSSARVILMQFIVAEIMTRIFVNQMYNAPSAMLQIASVIAASGMNHQTSGER